MTGKSLDNFTRGSKYQVKFDLQLSTRQEKFIEWMDFQGLDNCQLEKKISELCLENQITLTNKYMTSLNIDQISDLLNLNEFADFIPDNNCLTSHGCYSFNREYISIFRLDTRFINRTWNLYFFKIGSSYWHVNFIGYHFKIN